MEQPLHFQCKAKDSPQHQRPGVAQLRKPCRDMITMMTWSRKEFNGHWTIIKSEMLVEGYSRRDKFNLAKDGVSLLEVDKFTTSLIRLQTYTAIFVSDNRSGVLAAKIGIAPGMIPVGMAVDD